MLKSVDILVGLSVVMLVVSMAVTVLTHLVTTTLNTRGGHLMRGLGDLLQHLDPALSGEISKEISKSILKDPLVSDLGSRLGTVIGRGEFVKMLLDVAAGNGSQQLKPDVVNALKTAMEKNGIADPQAAVEDIRSFALTLEKSNPELANDVRMNMAIMHEAGSQFVAKINGRFDQIIDRVAARFTSSTQLVTFALALTVAFAIQLDAIGLVNRLSTDTQLRQNLILAGNNIPQGQTPAGVSSQTSSGAGAVSPGGNQNAGADSSQKKSSAPALSAPPNNSVPKDTKPDSKDAAASATQPGSGNGVATQPPSPTTPAPIVPDRVVSDVDAILGSTGLISAPDWNNFTLRKVLGILLSAVLLSLGAPFWYETLKTGLHLRAAIADKDDAQRLVRQTTQTPPQDSSATPAGMVSGSGALDGEKGDLSAVGEMG